MDLGAFVPKLDELIGLVILLLNTYLTWRMKKKVDGGT